ncbi:MULTISPECIES: TatD family hydrolase [unclassified Thiomonas]|uniref:TatD family hydrolase n=1 Tax=unclassified Thiomonas TaxID=2625466 RepID=UPI0004DBCA70|nr:MULTISPECIES: TatD family hydrolase [unclassified Thiomonas]CDW94900.1 putative deoxyribonuclease (TatD family) [Thiomonas sp. CB2]VDY04015.1 putative deoxyribonuclease (TatD family) [Thiomonas sp. Bio17B3]VDY08814.1 putative deoxyribonuclease (TatD family) [Thiomonas sp. Sup16B3]VDY12262.1 putative deoxyribonuclease (TatD family) [Thiomonas sp. OC7]VDY18524.1 putative deoxyribonuclease (TatD family) [Thiomonas sp. CB2]
MAAFPMQTMGWIDTHAHLDAAEFGGRAREVAAHARQAGVVGGVIPAVERSNFDTVRELAQTCGWAYALGIHPLYVDRAQEADLEALRHSVGEALVDPRFVGLGEIGLDFFVPGLDLEKQQRFYQAQLHIARDFDLPVILHVRKSQDALLAGLRRAGFGPGRPAGIAHAFNGSLQQAQGFINLGFSLGFGGAMTFERALNIRRLAAEVAETAPVLETDAPDIPPVWLYRPREARDDSPPTPNSSEQLPRIAQTLAMLRGWSPEQTARQTTANALRALPRLGGALNLGIESGA